MSTQYALREVKSEDAGTLAELMNELGYPTSVDEMAGRLRSIARDNAYHTVVAVSGARVVGVIGLGLAHFYERNGDYVRILVLSVSPDHRGAGVGTMLLESAEKWARNAGASTVFVNSGNQRTEAHAFYTNHGYRQTGLRFVKSLVTDT